MASQVDMPSGPMESKISLAVADPAMGCVSNDCKLDLVDATEA